MKCPRCGTVYTTEVCPVCGNAENKSPNKQFYKGLFLGLSLSVGLVALFSAVLIVGTYFRKQAFLAAAGSAVPSVDSSQPVAVNSNEATTTEATSNTENTKALLYNDDKVSIYFERCDTATSVLGDYEIIFLVENKTDVTLTIQAESMALDGISIANRNMAMSDEVAPKSMGRVYLRVKESISLSPKSISGELRVVDFNAESLDDRAYNAKFVDIAV